MLDALEEFFPPQAEWNRPEGGMFVWVTLPDFIDTTDLLARALRDNVAFVPGAGAFLDGRGSDSMRLNFSASGEDRIREGIRRIGKVITEQMELYGTLTGEMTAISTEELEIARQEDDAEAGARVVELRRKRARAAPGRGRVSRGRRAQGRALAGAPGVAALGRQRGGRARAGSATRWSPIDVGSDLIRRLREERPDVVFVALHGRDGEDGTVQELLEILDIPYTGSGVLACSRAIDKVMTKHLLQAEGIPTPDFVAFTQTAFRELGAADTLRGHRGAAGVPDRGQALAPGLGAGDQVRRARPPTCPARSWRPSPTTSACCWSATSRAATWRCRCSRARTGRRRCRSWRPCPADGDPYDYESRYDIGRTTFLCPAELGGDLTARAQELALATYGLLGCYGFARVDLMLSEDGELSVLEANSIPGPDRHQPAPPGRRGGRASASTSWSSGSSTLAFSRPGVPA